MRMTGVDKKKENRIDSRVFFSGCSYQEKVKDWFWYMQNAIVILMSRLAIEPTKWKFNFNFGNGQPIVWANGWTVNGMDPHLCIILLLSLTLHINIIVIKWAKIEIILGLVFVSTNWCVIETGGRLFRGFQCNLSQISLKSLVPPPTENWFIIKIQKMTT